MESITSDGVTRVKPAAAAPRRWPAGPGLTRGAPSETIIVGSRGTGRSSAHPSPPTSIQLRYKMAFTIGQYQKTSASEVPEKRGRPVPRGRHHPACGEGPRGSRQRVRIALLLGSRRHRSERSAL